MQIELLKKYVDQPLVINQIQLSLLHNDLIMDGIVSNMARADYTGARGTLDYCRLHDIQIQAWSPVAGGNLFNPSDDDPEHIHRTSALLNELADTHSTSPGAIALAWLLRHPAGIVPILGTMNPQRIVDSCEADNVQLSREDWYRLLEAANNHAVP
jgi:predicted oxidoreductase